jgi:hypothetical protein
MLAFRVVLRLGLALTQRRIVAAGMSKYLKVVANQELIDYICVGKVLHANPLRLELHWHERVIGISHKRQISSPLQLKELLGQFKHRRSRRWRRRRLACRRSKRARKGHKVSRAGGKLHQVWIYTEERQEEKAWCSIPVFSTSFSRAFVLTKVLSLHRHGRCASLSSDHHLSPIAKIQPSMNSSTCY